MPNNTTIIRVGKVESTNGYTTNHPYTDFVNNANGSQTVYHGSFTKNNHNTWMRDIVSGEEFQYQDSGTINARPGHTLGVMWYKGRSLLDYNLTLGTYQSVKRTGLRIWFTIIMTLLYLLFGALMYPFALMLNLSRLMGFSAHDETAFLNGPMLKTSLLYELIFIVTTGALYALMWINLGANDSAALFPVFFFVHLVGLQALLFFVRRNENNLFSTAMTKMEKLFADATALEKREK